MAVTMILQESPVDSVKQAVRSTSTCGAATVLTLQTLFRDSSKPSQEIESNTTRKGSRSISRTATTRGAKTKISAKDAKLNLLVEKDAARLSCQEKVMLATEVFNTTLKTLSDALKLSTSGRNESRVSTPNSALQPTSPNRAPKPSKNPKTSQRTQQTTTGADGGLLAVAECSSIALSCLRSLKSVQGGQEDGSLNIQLEQGACVLAGRYLSLGLNDMAYKELRGLKRRIQQYLDRQSMSEKKRTGKDSQQEPEEDIVKERMSDLLNFTNIAHGRPLHSLLVSFQSNSLRLIASEKRASTVQKVIPSLQLSNSSSPANVIMSAIESEALTKDKAALQLQMLSNTILSLCAGAQQPTDRNVTDCLKPIMSLTLQLLSLEVRCMSWEISGHVCDDKKEMWDPIARYLASFAHYSKGIEKTEFASIYKTIVRLQSAFAETQKRSATNVRNNLSVAKIATILGQLAQEAGCSEEALTLFTEALNPLSDGKCLDLATVRCKIASLRFQSLRSSKSLPLSSVSNAVSEVTIALGTPLKGSASDLDELLVEAAKLKKLAMGWLGDKVATKHDGDSEGDEVSDRIYEYLYSFVRFLRRYIGRQPGTDDEAKDHESFNKGVSAARSIVLAAVDSAVAIGKLSVMSQTPSWESMLSTLADCQRLLVAVDGPGTEKYGSSPADDSGLGFVKLSNLFWSRYLKEKESGKGYRDLLPPLKYSAYLLSSCSLSQRKLGFAALKFERLAHLYAEANMLVESEEAFCRSIKEHIDTGVLMQVLSDTAGGFPHRGCQDPKSSGFNLGRVLSAYLRMQLRNKATGHQEFFDDDKLPSLQRGLVLEWQTGILMELYLHGYSDQLIRRILSSVFLKSLDLYSPEAHPLRRSRVILSGLRLSLESPGCLESSLLRNLVEGGAECLHRQDKFGDDSDLINFSTHLTNSMSLTLGLHEGDLQPDELSRILSSWTSMTRICPDWRSLVLCVGDVEHYILQMKAVVDYTEIHGLWKLQLSALELVLRITELQETGNFSEAIIILSRLVLQYCRVGHCKKADGLLLRADQYLSHNEVSCLAKLSFKLARVEYLLETGDFEKAANIISTARVLFEQNQQKEDLNNCSVLSKMPWERLIADAAFMSSRLSFAQGSITQALFFAKLSVRLNCRIWAKVEKLSQRKQEKTLPPSISDLDTVVEGVARLDVSQAAPTSNLTVTYSQGAPFWPHIGAHHTALLNLASLSAYYGLFQDAVYYGEQALKINKTLNANVRLIASQVQLGSHWIFGGHITEGQELLNAAENLSTKLESSIELVSLHMAIASLHRVQGNFNQESRALLKADKIMTDVTASETSDVLSITSSMSHLEEGMDKLQIRGASGRTQQGTTTTTRRTRAATSSSRAAPKVSSFNADPPVTESQSLLNLKTDILRHQASCSRALREFEKASRLLTDARKYAISRDSKISLHIGESEHLLADAIRHFATHAVYCVLPESTISLPSLQSPKKAANEESNSTKQSASRKAKTPAKTSARGTRSKTPKASEDFAVMLSKASDSLSNVFSTATTLGSTLDSHTVSRLMSRISMLSHTTAPESSMSWSQSPANVNEIGRIGAFTREHVAIGIDKQLSDLSDPLLWPTTSSTAKLEEDVCTTFSKEYVDILPSNWNVLSLSLSSDRTEFIVSRLHKEHSPFLLRLPLKRGNSDDDEEQFTFEDGKNEMQEIINLANESSHAAKLQTDRRSKKDWWKNREALDNRLENLLQNIENVWFGGFRGIFSPMPRAAAALSRFATSFQNILDKHLPSRQKGGRTAGPRLTLHPNVLELFIGVKNLDDQDDPEDTLMDLLYFVVDILQFQGERNAYDEIDFDLMVVETLDALRGYHDAAQNEQEKQQPQHTVLVLDKALHLFPWESLPCLQGFPVCRVPSLECLRDRVLQLQSEKAENTRSGFGIDRRSGTYMLNPTGDLQSTQTTFEADLAGLSTWTGIVKRQPTEDEFKDSLESKSLFLYFGHGSGAQYIRGRTIKRLDRCAVAFLMGCSSGTLTEAGEYEPYGTPMNYLHAGSPALVATLWDVTDKDIDRFAKSTFEKWGLIGERGVKDEETIPSSKGRSRGPKSNRAPTRVTLDEAVSKSRDVCVLKYLNGAAPVIYGVPVFLE